MQPGGVMERNLVLSRKLAQATTAGVGVVSKANVDVVVAPLGAFGRDMLIPSPGIGWMPCTGCYIDARCTSPYKVYSLTLLRCSS